MSSIQEFLLELSEKDIRLWLEGDSLCCNAPQDVLTPALRDELAQHKSEIISFLSQTMTVDAVKASTIPPAPSDSVLPLAPNQQGLWFIDQLDNSLAAYNQSFAVELKGDLDINVLRRSLQKVIDRHSILRTNFVSSNGKPIQVIQSLNDFQLSQVDISYLSDIERRAEIDRFTIAEVQRPFNLAQDTLFRITLLHLGNKSHVLLFIMHHLIADGWSSGVIIKELGILYEAFLAGNSSPLPELSIQYADFAYWQQQQLEAVMEKQLSYWLRQLNGAPPLLQLPTDRPRQFVQAAQGKAAILTLGVDLTKRLKQLSQQHGVTLFTLLLAAFQVLLHRYTNQTDLCVGTTISNRDNRSLESLVGYCVNTVVLRTQLSGSTLFGDFLKYVQQIVFEAQDHKDLPFHTLVEKLQPQRDRSHTPLFQVVFVLESLGTEQLDLGDLTLSRWETPVATAKFDLSLSMLETVDGLTGRFEYDTDLFDDTTIKRLTGHFQTLLEAISVNPDQCLSNLPLLTNAEKQELAEWNNTFTNVSYERCIHELFEHQVEKTPDAIAVVFGDQQLTYRELNQRSNQLANYLQTLGVGPSSLVGICLERSPELIIGFLAILKAGGAYVPLDPAYPQERLSFMLSDAQVKILLTQQALLSSLSFFQAQTICLDTDIKVFEQASKANPTNKVTTDDLAYVIYTSGSTGKPKGVLVPHQGLLNLTFWYHAKFELSACDRATQIFGIAFDPCVLEIYPCLTIGATLYLAEPHVLRSPRDLQNWLLEHKITVTIAVTPLAEALLALDWPEQTALRVMQAGGEKLKQYPSQKIPFKFVNHYGPTENTVVTTSGIVAANTESDSAPLIGKPISNVQAHVLDSGLQPVPVGIPGELYIGGANLAKGYLNRPERTKKSFISGESIAHLTGSSSDCLYRTGDLVRYRTDGNIEFLGRIDHQVKLRGFRIELGEIEVALMSYPAVEQAVALIREDEPSKQKLVAYLVYQDDVIPSSSELKQWLRQTLPGYMIPSIFISLDSMPLTPNGKIDRRALPAPDASHYNSGQSVVVPSDAIEASIADIWAQVLGIGQIGIYDNFFELGGHSLIATQIIARIETTLGIELSLSNLFDTPTISELAVAARAVLQTAAPKYHLPAIEKSSHNDNQLPLSFAQARLVFLQKLQPHNPFYNIATSIHLQGILNIDALEQSLNEILKRHDSLRTRFLDQDEHTYAIITPFSESVLPLTDLSKIPGIDQETEVRRLTTEVACQPFDLTADQLFRIRLLRLSTTDHLMLLTMHHSIADGWSSNILMRELLALYDAFSIGRPASLPKIPIQYVDFAIWQNQHSQAAFWDSELAYWKRQLANAPTLLALPTDKPRPAVQTFSGNAQLFTLPKPLVKSLRVLGQQLEVTLFMLLLTAFKVLLYRYTSMTDILVGIPVANRNRIEVEPLIGCFVNTLVLRTDLSGNPSFQDLLAQVREVSLEAYNHQNLPFEKLLEELKLERDLGYSPLFQVMFSFEDTLELNFNSSDLSVNVSPIDTNTSKFDLSLNMVEVESGLMGRLEYNTDIFEVDRIERLVSHFEVLLESIIATPSQHISELSPLTSVEKQQFLKWNNTKADFPHNLCIHELFEAQAEQVPDAIAAVFDGQQLTYSELNQRANHLANYLQTLDVKSDTLVGVYLERSLDMLVGLLGILKAGAAYLPLDPSYPKERLSSIVVDSQVSILLTQQSLLGQLPDHPAHICCIDRDWALISQTAPCTQLKSKHSDQLAYVIYTSGSTGKPKGVKITHKNVVNFLMAMQHEFQVMSADSLLSVTSISFDISVLELFLPLVTGARVVIVNRQVAMNGQQLEQHLTVSNATLMQATPATWRLLLAAGWPGQAQLKILCGGEALSRDLASQLLDKGAGVWNLYGPTETTIWSTVHKLESSQLTDHTVAIGRPIANTQVLVLDSLGQPVPVGVPGELHIAGMGVAQGYLNRPELTSKKFISHPQLGRLYKTGDLVQFSSDGTLEYFGRGDHQVKLRGFRIELGEIEATLLTHAAVHETVVVAQGDVSENKRLVGYVVTSKDQSITVNELQQFLRNQLPDYMVPSAFVMLAALPLTPNGKVNRLALPQPDKQAILDTPYVEPKTSIERRIASIWQEILQLEKVSTNANFFHLGGHSLLLVKMQILLNKDLNQNLNVVDLFQYPTIKLLANYISQSHQAANSGQQAQERIITRQERQSAIKQARQMRRQHRAVDK